MKWLAVSYRMPDANEKNLVFTNAGNQVQMALWMIDRLASLAKPIESNMDELPLQLSKGDPRFILKPTDATGCDNAR